MDDFPKRLLTYFQETGVPTRGYSDELEACFGSYAFFKEKGIEAASPELVATVVTVAVSNSVFKMLVGDLVNFALAACQSPIEQAFLAALLCAVFEDHPEMIIVTAPGESGNRKSDSIRMPEFTGNGYAIHLQSPIRKYRADFVVEFCSRNNPPEKDSKTWIRKVAVECDGHDYHERTKEQASRDRKRDREFQSDGITVFRFTGSDIWRDAPGAAHEVIKFLTKSGAAGREATAGVKS